mmetsp:Transcript_39654/g.105600  ORF Transcript_39654/g.105600 Transcript_39654/m.105600 type:complete len:351 (+) Transcript_39654:83-1135(+)
MRARHAGTNVAAARSAATSSSQPTPLGGAQMGPRAGGAPERACEALRTVRRLSLVHGRFAGHLLDTAKLGLEHAGLDARVLHNLHKAEAAFRSRKPVLEGRIDGRDIGRVREQMAPPSIGLCQCNEVRVVQITSLWNIAITPVFIRNSSEDAVAEHDEQTADLVLLQRGELVDAHLHTTVARDGHHRGTWPQRPRGQGPADGVAHCAQPETRQNALLWLVQTQRQGSPERYVADVQANHRSRGEQRAEPHQNCSRMAESSRHLARAHLIASRRCQLVLREFCRPLAPNPGSLGRNQFNHASQSLPDGPDARGFSIESRLDERRVHVELDVPADLKAVGADEEGHVVVDAH